MIFIENESRPVVVEINPKKANRVYSILESRRTLIKSIAKIHPQIELVERKEIKTVTRVTTTAVVDSGLVTWKAAMSQEDIIKEENEEYEEEHESFQIKDEKDEKEGLKEEKKEIVQVEDIEEKAEGVNNDEDQRSNGSPSNSPRNNESNAVNSPTVNAENQEEKTLNPLPIQEQDEFDIIENGLYMEFMRKKINLWMPQ